MSNGQHQRQSQSQLHAPASPTPGSSSNTIPNGVFPSQSSGLGGMEQDIKNVALQEFFKSVASVSTIGELVRAIPVPAQPISRDILDGVYQACQKLGAAETLLAEWRDQLRTGAYADKSKNKVAQLNSIKPPVVQVCKEALAGSEGRGLESLNDFDATISSMKQLALNKMIEIKAKEVKNLQDYVQSRAIEDRLRAAWADVVTRLTGTITPEHADLLGKAEALQRVSRVAASIGESSYRRVLIAKNKKVLTKKDADVDMTDAHTGESRKQLHTLVKEMFKREQQSRQDRARSGKGKRSSGISKQQMKKTQKNREITKKKKGAKAKTGGSRNGKSKQTPNAKRQERR